MTPLPLPWKNRSRPRPKHAAPVNDEQRME
jgi:hypothetical protein